MKYRIVLTVHITIDKWFSLIIQHVEPTEENSKFQRNVCLTRANG